MNNYKKIFLFNQFRFFLLFIACFSPFQHPHIIRQVDTMGVSLRYWLRWFVELEVANPLLPAVLNSGDSYGIATMEFPFINIIFSPFFSLPIWWANPIARVFFLFSLFFLTFYHYRLWKVHFFRKNVDEHFVFAAALLPIFSISGLYLGKFMPDYPAFLFVSIAIAWSWRGKNRAASFLLASLGLLIKPPVVVGFGLIFFKKQIKTILTDSVWIVPSILVAILYYTYGLEYIRQQSDIAPYFYTEFRPPLRSLSQFLMESEKIFKVLNENLFTKFLFIVLLPLSAWAIFSKKDKTLFLAWGILLIQVLAIGALDGSHAFIHDYYFIGCSFICSIIFVHCYFHMNKKLQILSIALVFIPFLEKSFYEIRPLFHIEQSMRSQCQSLVKRNPDLPWGKGYSFRSDIEVSPNLGLCFGEIQNSMKNRYGFFKRIATAPQGCRILDETKDISLVECIEFKEVGKE